MIPSSQGFWLPKAGNADADYEDAYALGSDRIAIADGATESSFARAWARALVEGFSMEPEEEARANGASRRRWKLNRIQDRIVPLQQAWHDSVPWDRLPWFAEDKARAGAFSTLLAFQFLKPPGVARNGAQADPASPAVERRWAAMAIGDSCLFQIRDEAVRVAFPLERAEQFNSRPVLLCSNPANNDSVWEEVVVCEGDYRPGDILLLATDALARWFLTEVEAGERPWQTLCAVRTQAEFAALIDRLRAAHSIRNDDVTLVRIEPPGEGAPPEAESEEDAVGEALREIDAGDKDAGEIEAAEAERAE